MPDRGMPQFLTIGVYGFGESEFFQALVDNKIDCFCDIRFRRGLRGSKYKFANASYLIDKLTELNISYYHCKDLAPSPEIRRRQHEQDLRDDTTKRLREKLSPAFVELYKRHYLQGFDSTAFLRTLKPYPEKVVMFCVEKFPEACHRSLVAGKLEADLGIEVKNIMPCGS